MWGFKEILQKYVVTAFIFLEPLPLAFNHLSPELVVIVVTIPFSQSLGRLAFTVSSSFALPPYGSLLPSEFNFLLLGLCPSTLLSTKTGP